eukprot:403365187
MTFKKAEGQKLSKSIKEDNYRTVFIRHQRDQSVPLTFRQSYQKADPGLQLLNSYTLYNPKYSFNHKDFYQSFMNAKHTYKDELMKNVMKITMQHLMDKLDDNFEVQERLQKNKFMWGSLVLKSKIMQKLMKDFIQKIDEVAMTEIKHNKDLIEEFINTTGSKKEYQLFQNLETILENSKHIKQEKTKRKFKEYDFEKIKIKEEQFRQEELRKQEFVKNDMDKVKSMFNSIKQKVSEIEDLAEEVEDNNVEAHYRLDLIQEDRPYTQRLLGNNPPGDKIREMMHIWDMQKIDTNEDILQLKVSRFIINNDNLQGELWVTAEEFERKLEDDIKGFQLERDWIIKTAKRKLDLVCQHHEFYITALEQAMNEKKLQSMRQCEQSEMMLNDYQSKILNDYISDEEINRILQRAQNPTDLDDAKRKLQTLIKIVRNFQTQVERQKNEIHSLLSEKNTVNQEKAILQQKLQDMESSMSILELNIKKMLIDLGFQDIVDEIRLMTYNKNYADLKNYSFDAVYDYLKVQKEIPKLVLDIRNSMKNTKIHLVDDIWQHCESEKKNLINALKDDNMMKFLRIDPQQDEFLMQIQNPAKYRPSIASLTTRVIMKTKQVIIGGGTQQLQQNDRQPSSRRILDSKGKKSFYQGDDSGTNRQNTGQFLSPQQQQLLSPLRLESPQENTQDARSQKSKFQTPGIKKDTFNIKGVKQTKVQDRQKENSRLKEPLRNSQGQDRLSQQNQSRDSGQSDHELITSFASDEDPTLQTKIVINLPKHPSMLNNGNSLDITPKSLQNHQGNSRKVRNILSDGDLNTAQQQNLRDQVASALQSQKKQKQEKQSKDVALQCDVQKVSRENKEIQCRMEIATIVQSLESLDESQKQKNDMNILSNETKLRKKSQGKQSNDRNKASFASRQLKINSEFKEQETPSNPLPINLKSLDKRLEEDIQRRQQNLQQFVRQKTFKSTLRAESKIQAATVSSTLKERRESLPVRETIQLKSFSDQSIMTDLHIHPDQYLNMKIKKETLSTLSNLNDLISHQQTLSSLISTEIPSQKHSPILQQYGTSSGGFGSNNRRMLLSKNYFYSNRNSQERQPLMSAQNGVNNQDNETISMFESFQNTSQQQYLQQQQYNQIQQQQLTQSMSGDKLYYDSGPEPLKGFPFPKNGDKFFPNLTKKLKTQHQLNTTQSQFQNQRQEKLISSQRNSLNHHQLSSPMNKNTIQKLNKVRWLPTRKDRGYPNKQVTEETKQQFSQILKIL